MNNAQPIDSAPAQPRYHVWGHADEELKRLEAQGSFLAAMTKDFLASIGIAKGMRVLDVGCGTGDVSFLAAELVGPTGQVVGLDRADAALSSCTARAWARKFANVRFVLRDIDEVDGLSDLGTGRPFDAVVGRLIFVHHPRPAEAVRKMIGLVRPGGVVGFQEIDLDASYWSTHELTAMNELHAYIQKFVECGMLSAKLLSAFERAFNETGIVQRRIVRSANAIECGVTESAIAWVEGLGKLLMTAAPKMGLPPPAYDPNSLKSRLKLEVTSHRASFSPAYWITAMGRVPHLSASR